MCHSLHSHLLVQQHLAEDNTQYFHYINTQSYHPHSTKLNNCVWQTCMVISEIQKWATSSTEWNNMLKNIQCEGEWLKCLDIEGKLQARSADSG